MSNVKETDSRYVAGTYARFPVVLVSGKGSVAVDDNGKEYIDMESGYGTNSFGFCDDEWLDAVTAQAGTLQHTSNLYYTEPCAELAKLLSTKTGMQKTFFCNSGSEANECAIKAARKYAELHKGKNCSTVISMKNGFHGRSYASLSATGMDHYHAHFGPMVPGFVYADFNDIESVEKLIDADTAAIMFECIQGEGGVNVMTQEFADGLAEIASEHDIILIADEVQAGNGRSGELYSYMHYGLYPDLVTTAKGIGGGLPIGVCMFGKKTADVLVPGDNGSTFGGNPVACAGALSILSRIDGKFLADVRRKSEYVFSVLEGSAGVKDIEGAGLMIGITPLYGKASEIADRCLERGVLCITAGENRVRLLPPLNIPDELLEKAMKIIKEEFANNEKNREA